MGNNVSGDDFEVNDKEVFQSYRIPPKAYKKRNKDSAAKSDASLKSIPGSPTSLEFNSTAKSYLAGSSPISQQRQGQHTQHQQQQHRLRAGSLSSTLNQPRRDRPVSHPPSVLSGSSSTSSLNLSIVNAAVSAGLPSFNGYGHNSDGHNQLNSAPLPAMVNGASLSGSRTNSGYSLGSHSFEPNHCVGSGLGRATYVNGKMVEMGIHGNGYLPQGSSNSLYTHSNYTVQDFKSYQHQQQQQFLEQQHYEYQQMLLLQQQQQQLKQQYEQQQLLLLQQQQKLHSGQIAVPLAPDTGSNNNNPLPPPPQDQLSQYQQITDVILQTKTRRPARHPDRSRSTVSQSISIPTSSSRNNHNGSGHHGSSSGHSLQRQGNAKATPSPRMVSSSQHRSPTLSYGQATQYGTSPLGGSMASSYTTTNGASSFSSTGSHFQNMLAMTSASPPSSSSSSLSNVEEYHHSSQPQAQPQVPPPQHQEQPYQQRPHYQQHQEQQQPQQQQHINNSTDRGIMNKGNHTIVPLKSGLTIEEIAAKILPPRRMLGGREYYPDKTLPYLLPCDEQESERLLLQHYVIRYAFGANIIPPVDTSIAGKVLDCGCGPGTWIMEMATEFEDLDFYGFDVSPMYPSAIHPKNAHFSMANLLDPEIPFASDSYLLVHQRNMLLGITQDAWPGVVQDLYRCVIPGGSGWLQLSEVDPIWCRPGPISRSVLKMLNETALNRNVDILLPQQLDRVLKEVGCEQVKMIMVEIPIGPWGGKIGMLWRDVLKAEMEALKPVVLQAALENAVAAGMDVAVCGAEMTTAEEWEEMMTSVWAEMDQFRTFSRVYLAYGQKS